MDCFETRPVIQTGMDSPIPKRSVSRANTDFVAVDAFATAIGVHQQLTLPIDPARSSFPSIGQTDGLVE